MSNVIGNAIIQALTVYATPLTAPTILSLMAPHLQLMTNLQEVHLSIKKLVEEKYLEEIVFPEHKSALNDNVKLYTTTQLGHTKGRSLIKEGIEYVHIDNSEDISDMGHGEAYETFKEHVDANFMSNYVRLVASSVSVRSSFDLEDALYKYYTNPAHKYLFDGKVTTKATAFSNLMGGAYLIGWQMALDRISELLQLPSPTEEWPSALDMLEKAADEFGIDVLPHDIRVDFMKWITLPIGRDKHTLYQELCNRRQEQLL